MDTFKVKCTQCWYKKHKQKCKIKNKKGKRMWADGSMNNVNNKCQPLL